MSKIVKSLVDTASDLAGRFIVDRTEAAKLAHEIETMAERHGQELALAQIAVNEEAAKHPSLFVAGARPAALWICVFGLGFQIFIRTIAWCLDVWFQFQIHIGAITGEGVFVLPTPPVLVDMTLLFGLLGLAGARTFEKVKGVARENMK